MFNLDLWRISGHYDHYLENMFTFEVENQGFGLKVCVVMCCAVSCADALPLC